VGCLSRIECLRQIKPCGSDTITDKPVDFNLFYPGGPCNFPLYLYPENAQQSLQGSSKNNVSATTIGHFSTRLGLSWLDQGRRL